MIFILQYPHKDLMPNRKNGNHWAKTLDAKVNQCRDAYFTALQAAQTQKQTMGDTLALKLVFVQSDKRKRDLDNLLAASKSSIDGIAKALKIDDSFFEPIILMRGFDTTFYLKVEIT